MAEWAQPIIDDFGTYAEISPSGTGVKLWCQGKLPINTSGKKRAYGNGDAEMYQHSRYFAFTGNRLADAPETVNDAQEAIDKWWPILFPAAKADERGNTAEFDRPCVEPVELQQCEDQLAKLDDAVSGASGSNATIHALCEIRRRRLNEDDSWKLIHWFNDNKCQPAWEQSELERKWNDAKGMTPVVDATKVFDAIEGETVTVERPKGIQTGLIPVHQFGELDENIDFLIDNVLAAGEPFIIGGPTKVLKTAICIDMCYALTTGTPFLGYFKVPRPVRVAFFSAETHPRKLRHRYEVLREKYGIDSGDNLMISRVAPKLSVPGWLDAIESALRKFDIDVCLIDPAYKSVYGGAGANASSDASSSVWKAGEVLEDYYECGAEQGCNVGLCHHVKKTTGKGQATHDELSGAGFAEWTRQSMMINRKGKYANNGKHKLVLSIMGTQGFGGEYLLNIDEGCKNGLTGHLWDVKVTNQGEGVEALDAVEGALSPALQKTYAAVVELSERGVSATPTKVAEHVGGSFGNAKKRLNELVGSGHLDRRESQEGEAGNQKAIVYELSQDEDEALAEIADLLE